MSTIKRFRKRFKNWPRVIYHLFRSDFPVRVEFRDGSIMKVRCKNHLWDISYGFEFEYTEKDSISFRYNTHYLKFYGTCDNGSIGDVYIQEELKNLDIKGNIIIDVGANIGDSSIYFAIKGASKVIAIEPFPTTFDFLSLNIQTNNFSDNIIPLNIAIDSEPGHFILSENLENSVATMASDGASGFNIAKMTIDDLFKEYNIIKALLKIDCEGCEYKVLRSISKESWEKILEITVEYHACIQDLKNILEQNGFTVSEIKKNTQMGLLYGKRRSIAV